MTNRLLVLFLTLPLLFFTGCASSGSGAGGATGNASAEDIEEAKIVELGLSQTSDMKGRFTVIPGDQFTTVVFSEPNIPHNPEELRQSMKDMRGFLRFKTQREPNRLRFVFPGATLEE